MKNQEVKKLLAEYGTYLYMELGRIQASLLDGKITSDVCIDLCNGVHERIKNINELFELED